MLEHKYWKILTFKIILFNLVDMFPKRISKIQEGQILKKVNLEKNHVQKQKSTTNHQIKMLKPTNPIEWYTLGLLLFTVILAIVAIIQIRLVNQSNQESKKASDAATIAAEAAVESNEISRQLLIAEQRPWIKLNVEIGGPLSYTDKGWDAGMRWHFPLKYTLKNIGKTPGVNVSLSANIIPYTLPHFPKDKIKDGVPQGMPIEGTDIAAELARMCEFPEAMTSSNMGFGQTLFPNDQIQGLFGLNGDPKRFDEAKTNEANTHQFLVVVCVSYGSTISDKMYRTAEAFQLLKNNSGFKINLEGESILEKDLALVSSPQQFGKIVE